ncbi:MAG: hypothetical protein Q7J51_13915 [Sheuella sp.]|jgi:hypothetical protein|nr:hypothetical protein [Sheuella sp.]
METRLISLEARFDTVMPALATHTDISTLETKIAKVESTLVKWFAGVGIAIITVLLSAMSFFFSSMHSSPIQSPQPIIIHIPAPVIATHKN